MSDKQLAALPEPARFTVVGTRMAPPVELARWLLEERSVYYQERTHAPVFHALASFRRSVKMELPLVITSDGASGGVIDMLTEIDRRSRVGERVFGESDAERRTTLEFVDLCYKKLFTQAVQLFYYYSLRDTPALVRDYGTRGAPLWQTALVYGAFPLWKFMLRRGLRIRDFDPDEAVNAIKTVYDFVEQRLDGGDEFLSGSAPGTADYVFASLSAPVMFPAGFGASTPSLEELGKDLAEIVKQFRDRRGGELIQATYDRARPSIDRDRIPLEPARRSLASRIVTPAVVRAGAKLFVKRFPRVSVRNLLIISRWREVTEVLTRDRDFSIEPINRERIEAVCGEFILGIDRKPALMAQRKKIYGAMQEADTSWLMESTSSLAQQLLDSSYEAHQSIDIVNGYARLIACRNASRIFGILGPTEHELLRALRALFRETFLNLNGDADVKRKGLEAAGELNGWIDHEIESRLANHSVADDVLGRMLLEADPDEVRRMIGGLIVGAVDTTATAMGNIVAEALADRGLLRSMMRDRDDLGRLRGWCWEALRRRPHNPILLREAIDDTSINGHSIAAGTRVILFTLAAMHDPSAFERPGTLDANRPRDRYLHFGYGLHQCAGRDVNEVQIPVLMRELLRFSISGKPTVLTHGPFPDKLVVGLAKDST